MNSPVTPAGIPQPESSPAWPWVVAYRLVQVLLVAFVLTWMRVAWRWNPGKEDCTRWLESIHTCNDPTPIWVGIGQFLVVALVFLTGCTAVAAVVALVLVLREKAGVK